ncbi:MAG: hypothetical protein MUF31_08200 [Akkermansiaceae bacterium]|jgi:hypothetical protein|nr:hypothetical protein [Akkermansiaceae bacterium]
MTDPLSLPAEQPGIIEVSGTDAVRFLNGQITQDARSLGQKCLPACITDAKGRLQHAIEIQQGPTEGLLWLITRPDALQEIIDRLDRYRIADDVEFATPAGWTRVRSSGNPGDADLVRESQLWFDEGRDHWWQGAPAISGRQLSESQTEDLRIARGIPAWDRELIPGLLPPEAGLDKTAISYHKGCYIGQEVLSRIKSAGKLNRRLARLSISPALGGQDGTRDNTLLFGGKEVGTLTSLSSDGSSALGYLGKSAFDADALSLASRPGLVVRRLGWA